MLFHKCFGWTKTWEYESILLSRKLRWHLYQKKSRCCGEECTGFLVSGSHFWSQPCLEHCPDLKFTFFRWHFARHHSHFNGLARGWDNRTIRRLGPVKSYFKEGSSKQPTKKRKMPDDVMKVIWVLTFETWYLQNFSQKTLKRCYVFLYTASRLPRWTNPRRCLGTGVKNMCGLRATHTHTWTSR